MPSSSTSIGEYLLTAAKSLDRLKWFLLAVVAVGLYFYWSQLRPVAIYKKCQETATKAAIETLKRRGYGRKDEYNPADYEVYYKICLRSKGIRQ